MIFDFATRTPQIPQPHPFQLTLQLQLHLQCQAPVNQEKVTMRMANHKAVGAQLEAA